MTQVITMSNYTLYTASCTYAQTLREEQ